MAVQLSTEHNASSDAVRDELRSLHPDDPQIVVMKHKVWRVKGLIQINLQDPVNPRAAISQISRSIGDVYLKKA
ncbi:hypothetical protein V6N11_049780 [Hibiscus sabdariffa]|uniref:BON domain-containing protein n=1 Tax=Hibiscus sabdariffa TaxID=183260 RepID=A0ABR2T8U4_9ROSI